jgi:hypothetical protein
MADPDDASAAGDMNNPEDRSDTGVTVRGKAEPRSDSAQKDTAQQDPAQQDPAAASSSNSGLPATTTPVHVVSLRSGPNSSSQIIGTLRPGMQLDILGTAGYGWVQVRSPAGTGWAYGSYLASGGGRAISPASASDVASANDSGNTPAQAGDTVGKSVTNGDTAHSAAASAPPAPPKPAGVANPALTGGGPALAGGGPGPTLATSAPAESAQTGRSGLASQITSP